MLLYELKKVYTLVAIFVTIVVLICVGLVTSELNKMNLEIRSKAFNINSLYDIDKTIDDRSIDIRDFSYFMKEYGVKVCGSLADFNFDCRVNISDYSMFRNYYPSKY